MSEYPPDDLTVVIPTRNRWDVLARTLQALRGQSVSGFETVVVVDGTDQQPPELANTRVIVKDHAGPGAARNVGVRSSDRPLVLFLGDDMVPAPDLVARHLEQHRAHPGAEEAVLGFARWHPDVASSRIHRWMDWSATQFDYDISANDAGWGRFYSSNVSLKRDFFLAAGGFDEEFTYYYEDLDLAWRLNEKGMRLFFAPDAVTNHLHRYRWPDVVRRFQGIARGEYLMSRKHPSFSPFFRNRLTAAAVQPRARSLWPRLVDIVPERITQLRAPIQRRSNRWYLQQLAPHFLDSWEGERDLDELRDYLGEAYDHTRLTRHTHEVRAELDEVGGDESTLYRTSEAYLYDLTVFAMSGTKIPYRTDLERLVPRGGTLLDWGCGIGADGLRFIADGYRVAFADFDNPSTRYLRWRLGRRGIQAPVFDIDSDDIPSGFDAAFAFDVIEHVEDPFGFLDELEQRAAIVMVNLLEVIPDDPHPHRALPIEAILDHAAGRGILRYRRYHGRSHLVAYRGSKPASKATDRLTSAARRRFGALVGGR